MQRVPEADHERQTLSQPAEKTPIPPVTGYADGHEILFVHTDPSAPDTGAYPTQLWGSPPAGDRAGYWHAWPHDEVSSQ
jgi:hypothetical protein